jgi:hypothetical protein
LRKHFDLPGGDQARQFFVRRPDCGEATQFIHTSI